MEYEWINEIGPSLIYPRAHKQRQAGGRVLGAGQGVLSPALYAE